MVKVRTVVYDEKSLQQVVSQETTIWATHERRDSSVGASKLLQQGHLLASNCLCQDRRGGQGVDTYQFSSRVI